MKHQRIKPGHRLKLDDHDPADTGDYDTESEAADRTSELRQTLAALQESLYVERSRALLIVLQGIDTSGKDGTIRHVMSGINPQGSTVTAFKAPTPEEKAHDFLWRAHAACPARGYIGIFNRSHYEDVLITRVHDWITDEETERRLEAICDFERMLADAGARIVKFLLHISKDEQKRRLLARVDDPNKRWKMDPADVSEREYWHAYQHAFERAVSATSTEAAPWFIVPSDHKWYRNLVIARHVVHALQDRSRSKPERAALTRVARGKFNESRPAGARVPPA